MKFTLAALTLLAGSATAKDVTVNKITVIAKGNLDQGVINPQFADFFLGATECNGNFGNWPTGRVSGGCFNVGSNEQPIVQSLDFALEGVTAANRNLKITLWDEAGLTGSGVVSVSCNPNGDDAIFCQGGSVSFTLA